MKTKLLKTALLASLLTSAIAIADEGTTFAGVSLGYTNLNVKQEDKIGAIILGNKLEESGYNIRVEAGYNYSENIDVTINYQRVIHDDTYQNNFFIGSEYKLNRQNNFTPYVGAQLGYSELHWDKNPMNTTTNDYTSGSYLVGATLGATYPLSEKVDLNINYNLQYTNHTTHLESAPAKSELTHDFSHSFNVGVRYSF
jgi:opacity protein-like surface antigen